MAQEIARVDVADVIAGQVSQAKEALEKGEALLRVYAIPAPELRIRAKKRIIRLDEGKLARLVYSLVTAAAKGSGSFKFKEFGSLVGDYKAAAAFLASLWRRGLVGFEDEETALNIYIAANSLSQKTYEHRIAKVLEKTVQVNLDALRKLPSDEILCVQRGGLVLCRYAVSNAPRIIAKAQARAVISLAGYRPA
ncbi:MAG: hypothetical protein GXO15_00330 [Crenarchaeota archaeon]|nr:hypothetical protein [Thermoproteota archaeon]